MQYEYDSAVVQLKDGREGLEQYRALVERVSRQVAGDKQHVSGLEGKIGKPIFQAGDRDTAARFALELQKAKQQQTEDEDQLKMHEEAYNNNLAKIKHATGKLADVRDKIAKYDADLKMSRAEAEMAKLATSFNFDVTTDFGQIEAGDHRQDQSHRATGSRRGRSVERRIGRHPAQSGGGKSDGRTRALRDFEVQMGMVSLLATVPTTDATKELGPATKEKQTQQQS